MAHPCGPSRELLVLILSAGRLPRGTAAVLGVGSVAVSAGLACLVAADFVSTGPSGGFTQVLWTWIDLPGFTPQVAFHLDALSVVMILVVTVVGFLIHLYSAEYMRDDEGFHRFFAYMNLFVASMLTLVLADNLLLLYAGWELVGICSYLLIGFLVQGGGQREGCDQGLCDHPCRRYGHGVGSVPAFPQPGDAPDPGADAQGASAMACGIADSGAGCRAPSRRSPWEIGPDTASDLASRRHGRPDSS